MKKKYIKHIIVSLSLAAMLLVSMTACGSKSSAAREVPVAGMYAETAAAAAIPEEMAYRDSGAGAVANMKYAAANDSFTEIEEADIEAGSAAAEQDAAAQNRKLIRNVNLDAQTENFDQVSESLRAEVSAFGGYIEYMDQYGNSRYSSSRDSLRFLSLTARIPADRLDAFLNGALEGAVIVSRSESTEDVTLRYTDLDSRKKVLRTEMDRLTELLAQADSIEAVIALEDRLSEVRYEIESIEQSLRSYDNRVSYSTVNIILSEVSVAKPQKKAGTGERILIGLRRTFKNIGESATEFFIWFVVNLPVMIILAVIILIIVFIAKKLGLKKKNTAKKKASGKKPKLFGKKSVDSGTVQAVSNDTENGSENTDHTENTEAGENK